MLISAGKFLSGMLSAVGGLLLFIGFFQLLDGTNLLFSVGIGLLSIAEALGVYLLQYETAGNLRQLHGRFWQELGATWAIPLLMGVLYLFSRSRFLLSFALVSAVLSFFRSAGWIIKQYYITAMNKNRP